MRKPKPSPPKWYWADSDNCWFCNNRTNCNACKIMKKLSKYDRTREKEKTRRIKEQFNY